MADLTTDAAGRIQNPAADFMSPGGLNQLADFWSKLFGANKTETSTTSSPLAEAPLQALIASLFSDISSSPYTREGALKDSAGGVNEIIQKMLEQSMPQVLQAQATSGGYNASTARLMGNDLAARAAGQGAALQADTIAKYAQIQQQKVQGLIQALNSAVTASKIQQSTTATQGLAQNNAAKKAALAAAAMQMFSAKKQANKNKLDTKVPQIPDQPASQTTSPEGGSKGEGDTPSFGFTSSEQAKDPMAEAFGPDTAGISDFAKSLIDPFGGPSTFGGPLNPFSPETSPSVSPEFGFESSFGEGPDFGPNPEVGFSFLGEDLPDEMGHSSVQSSDEFASQFSDSGDFGDFGSDFGFETSPSMGGSSEEDFAF